MRSIALVALVAIALTAAPGAQACGTSSPEGTATTPLGTFYVDNDLCQLDGCIASVVVYQESNGQSGLQRHDGQVDNTCGGAIHGDRRIA